MTWPSQDGRLGEPSDRLSFVALLVAFFAAYVPAFGDLRPAPLSVLTSPVPSTSLELGRSLLSPRAHGLHRLHPPSRAASAFPVHAFCRQQRQRPRYTSHRRHVPFRACPLPALRLHIPPGGSFGWRCSSLPVNFALTRCTYLQNGTATSVTTSAFSLPSVYAVLAAASIVAHPSVLLNQASVQSGPESSSAVLLVVGVTSAIGAGLFKLFPSSWDLCIAAIVWFGEFDLSSVSSSALI